MTTEDDKKQEGFAAEGGEGRGREGYRAYNQEGGRPYGRPAYDRNSDGEGGDRPHFRRPRVPRGAERAYGSNPEGENRYFRPRYNAAEGEGRPGGYRPRFNREGGNGYNREGGYQPRENGYNREGGYRREGGFHREGGYQPRREGGYNNFREGGFNRDSNYNREGGYRREGGFQPRGGYRPEGQRPYGQPGNRFGGRPQQRRFNGPYDPNAKYSMKKRIEYREQNIDPDAPIRLNKFLANAGVCSRREADDFIAAGVVTVNGEVKTELGTKVKRSDEVKFHDQPVNIEKKVYVLLNKPKDYVTTSEDPQNRKTVMDLVRDACRERIYPVGRLDRNTTGVLLLTNDGEMASKLTHPQYLKKKIYHVYTDKNVTAADMRKIAEGIVLDDGEIHADAIEYASETDKKQVGIEIHSGRNRIVRRIFESLGYRVLKLDRVYFAGLTKKNVRRGDWRFLTEKEVDMLRMGAFE